MCMSAYGLFNTSTLFAWARMRRFLFTPRPASCRNHAPPLVGNRLSEFHRCRQERLNPWLQHVIFDS